MSTKTMADRVEEYLAYRHALGYQLHKEGQRLRSFARFADQTGHKGPLTTEIALRWARQPARAARPYQARRLGVVRTLARYARLLDVQNTSGRASQAPRFHRATCSARPTPVVPRSST